MGLLDSVRELLGIGAESAATKAADPDDLFGMSTAYITMDADLNFEPIGLAGLVFAGIDSTDFDATVSATREIIEAGDEGTIATVHTDQHGYHWVVLEDPDFEDLVVGVHAAADEFIIRGYGPRLLAAVFGFERRHGSGFQRREPLESEFLQEGTRVYWIYSFRRGGYYPFVPLGEQERDHGTEFKLQSVLSGELDIVEDESYWYPLWPDRPETHPWE